MKRSILLTLILLLTISYGFSQTLEDLKAEKAAKKDSIAQIQNRVDNLQKQIDKFPGWKIGAFGTIGGSFSEFNNWYAQGTPNNSSAVIGISINPFAKFDSDAYFWYNQAQVNLSWVKFDDKDDPTDDDSYREATDVFNIISLFGYNLSEKFAISTLAEYRTTLLNNFNDPGYLDLGIGATWKPISGLVVVLHPLNYNFVFSEDDSIFESSFGTKILATYSKSISDFEIKSVFSTFQSYKSSNLSNWTWTNSFNYKLWKTIGLGFEFGLRDNNQEALNYAYNQWDSTGTDPEPTFYNISKDLQTYWLFGLSYSF
jgi:hypothetical protein